MTMRTAPPWPPIGSRVRFPRRVGGTQIWLYGKVIEDPRNNDIHIAVDRDGYRPPGARNWVKHRIVMRNRSQLELMGAS